MWHHTNSYSLKLGWDKPLQGFYLVIYPKHDPNQREKPDYLWSNLDFEDPHPKDFKTFQPALELFNIELPYEVYYELARQKLQGQGMKHPLAFRMESS